MSSTSVCRLLIVDDHPMLTQSLTMLLAGQAEFQVVNQFHNGNAVLDWLNQAPSPLPADVLLLDLHLPGSDGLTVLQQVRRQWPALQVLIFSMTTSAELIKRVTEEGARGFVPKTADADQLLNAIRAVHAGQTAFDATLQPQPEDEAAATPLLRLNRLSPREREVVRLILQGHTSQEIANQLFIAKDTVTTHRKNIMHKLELPNMVALVSFALEHGL